MRGLKITSISPALLIPSISQPREQFDDEKIGELAASIKQYGILQPILVRKTTQAQFEIIAGERRWRAAKLAQLKKLPCVVTNLINEDAFAVALIENIQREDLNPIEEANAYKRLIKALNINQDQVAQRVGKDRATIANTLRLLRLPKDIQDMVSNAEISMGHARALLALDNQEIISFVAKKIIREGLSVRRVESLIRALKNGSASLVETKKNLGAQEIVEPMVKEIQKKIEYELGLKAILKRESNGAYVLSISFLSASQLNDILDRLSIEI
ncbi:MAG: putative chromosome-partitioning protein ParB [bacterium ADurb.BinA186]|nr:MAG: putative chromosome-partitioning protein ParB [bacterium ADurb.BinA186]